MREAIQDEMARDLEAAEASFKSPEVIEAEHFLEEFRPARVTAAKIAELKAKYSGLTIAGVEDRKGYDLVHSARMEIREYRVAVEKVRKALKEESLAYGRKVDAEAKRITAKLTEIEDPLDLEESRIDAERERVKAEKQREKDAELQRRVDALNAVHHPYNIGDLVTMPDTAFALMLATAQEAWEAKEKLRIEAEAALEALRKAEAEAAERAALEKAAAEKAERERLDAQRAEQAAKEAELAAGREALRKEQEAFEARKRAEAQAERDEQIRKEAAERAKAEAERAAAAEKARLEREAGEAEARRQAALAARPDADKLLALAETLRGTAYPKLTTPDAQKVIADVEVLVRKLVAFIEDKAAALSPRVTA